MLATEPGVLPRLEGAAILAVALWAYADQGLAWPLFALLFLAPDPVAPGYPAGARVGGAAYNLAHTLA